MNHKPRAHFLPGDPVILPSGRRAVLVERRPDGTWLAQEPDARSADEFFVVHEEALKPAPAP